MSAEHFTHEGIKLRATPRQTLIPGLSAFEQGYQQPPRTHRIHGGSI